MSSRSDDGPRPVDPVSPVAPWLGGKARLAKRLCAMIEAAPHRLYAEPFVGMGGVFFRRRLRPRVEIINDKNNEIANLFLVLRHHYPALLDEFRFAITSRHWFLQARSTAPEMLTDIQRAARFLYLQRLSYGGIYPPRSFRTGRIRAAYFDLSKLEPMLAAVHERLCGVVIECLDWRAFIDRYDAAETLFFLDPPYVGGEDLYGRGLFDRTDYEIMADRLADLKGKFILTLNDTPEVRRIFRGFAIEAVEAVYYIGPDNAQTGRQVVITPRQGGGRTPRKASRKAKG